MGRYDGVLLCSDIDGTLTWGELENGKPVLRGPTPEVCEKIAQFQAQGGRFTVCTGRAPAHLKNFAGKFTVNAPVIAYGGALVVDTATGGVLRRRAMRFDLPALLRPLRPLWPHVLQAHLHDEAGVLQQTTPEAICSPKGGIWREDAFLKLVLVFDEEANAVRAQAAARSAAQAAGVPALVCRSWPEGLEMMSAEANKGDSARFLKQALGAEQLICVGDYENDLSMAAADRFVAVGNALPQVKAAADEVTVDVTQGPLARVIDSIGRL